MTYDTARKNLITELCSVRSLDCIISRLDPGRPPIFKNKVDGERRHGWVV